VTLGEGASKVDTQYRHGLERGRTKADSIADEIERAIVNREFRTGTVVGSEGAIAARYAVSRPVVREAFRILELSGIASVRRGPGGGLVVEEPNAGPVVAAARRFLGYRGVSRSELLSARLALELACVNGLATSIDEDKIFVLRRVLDQEHRAGPQLVGTGERLAEQLHYVIAELAGNAAFALFVPVLAQLSSELTELGQDDCVALSDQTRHAHAVIVEAIITGDGGLAQHRMRRHLNALADRYATADGR
jgi:DNA-binding FadR family transcriptional regulator